MKTAVVRGYRAGLVALTALGLTALASAPVQAQPAQPAPPTWTVSAVPTSLVDFVQNEGANPINDAGLVAGRVGDTAAVYDVDTHRVKVLPGQGSSIAIDVNNHGDALVSTGGRPLVWSTRTGRLHPVPSSIVGYPVALNDRADVLLGAPAALWNYKKRTVRSLTGMTGVLALNNRRWVVGQGGSTGGAAVWTPRAGTRNLPSTLRYGKTPTATAINDEGQIVGNVPIVIDPDPHDATVLWKTPTSKPCRVGPGGGVQATVRAINRRGEMVGLATRLEPGVGLNVDYAYWKGCGSPTTILQLPPNFGDVGRDLGPNGINTSSQIVGSYIVSDTGGTFSSNFVWKRSH